MAMKNSLRRDNFLRFEEGKEKKLMVTDWDFTKHPSGYLFRCYVTKEDGNAIDKIWTVWDYGSAQVLKKRLKVKFPGQAKEISVVMSRDDEGDAVFSVK